MSPYKHPMSSLELLSWSGRPRGQLHDLDEIGQVQVATCIPAPTASPSTECARIRGRSIGHARLPQIEPIRVAALIATTHDAR
jgi:hypothetical protein